MKNKKNKKIEKSTDIITYSPPLEMVCVCIFYRSCKKENLNCLSLAPSTTSLLYQHTLDRAKKPWADGVGPGTSPILFILTLPSLV
jgi:hypothetical protein